MTSSFTLISGLIGGEPEFADYNNNRKATLSVYTSRPYKNAQGEYDTDIHNVQAWGRTTAYLTELQSIHGSLKGMVAMVSGHMESYKNGEGQKCWTLKAERIAISPRPSKTNGNGDDGLPF